MADIESNIKVNIDTSDALAQLKLLQQQISAFQQAMRNAGSANAKAAAAMQQNLVNSINATGQFRANIQTIKTSAESFTEALEKNKLSMGEYFRYAGGASKSFGKFFKSEFATIQQVAIERVKTIQTQFIKLGRDANGAMKAIAVRPLALDMDSLSVKTQLAAQRQQLFNQLMKQGSTQLLNFGKNTQWAGRQLMVGFTIPLTMMGAAASKAYMQIEAASIKFKRVYGDMNTTTTETNKMVKSVQALANEFTKYGLAVADTMDMAASAAAMGKTGADLLAQIDQAAKLSILGGVEQQQALETTISLTNAFGVSTKELATNVDFLNAVENQTVVSIEDLTIAIPKAAPVVKQLGGDVKDLAFFLTAMKEGGINASEGANALKSGLASMINPTAKASQFLQSFGINLKGIVEANKGDVRGTVVQFAKALDTLDPLNRARAIEQLFGKFQFSRLSTLFQNVIAEGSQATKVAGLANQTAEELAVLSEREMKKVEDSPMFKFQKSVQDMQAKLAPVGEAFLKAVTPIIEFVGKILDGFNSLSEGSKRFITILVTAVAGIGPVLLMGFGLIANGVANVMKLFTNMKSMINKSTKPSDLLGQQTTYMSEEQLRASAIAASLDQAHAKLKQTFDSERTAVEQLTKAYRDAVNAQQGYAGIPGVPVGNPNAKPVKKYAGGVHSVPGPAGAGDIVPALLSPGEAVIPAKQAQKYRPVISGMIAGNLPGFEEGTAGVGMRQSIIGPLTQKQTEGLAKTALKLDEISKEVMAGPYANVAPTNYGTQISPSTGHSFPAFGVGGIYQKPDGTKVFVKPQVDLTSAQAEMRGTQIARDAHGLQAPKQKIAVMMDPTDPQGQRRFIVLESPVDEKFANIPTTFTKDQYFKQLVASLLRGDKDLGLGNLGGDVLADVGPAGVFQRASGKRELGSRINSMEEQAIINLLGVKGGAKRFFAEATSEIAKSMTPAEYSAAMKAEIQAVMPKLAATIAGFGNLNPQEKAAYMDMQKRLQAGLGVDWGKYQVMHSAVPPKKYATGATEVSLIQPKNSTKFAQSLSKMSQAELIKHFRIQDTHLVGALDIKDPRYLEQVRRVFPGATEQELQGLEPVSNLTAQLPGNLNQGMKSAGYSGKTFGTIWNSFIHKLSKSAKIAGISLPESQILEDQLGNALSTLPKVNDKTADEMVGKVLGQNAKIDDMASVKSQLWGLALNVGGLRSKLKNVKQEDERFVTDITLRMLRDNAVIWNKNRTGLELKIGTGGEGPRVARWNLDPFGSGSESNGIDQVELRRRAQEAAYGPNGWAFKNNWNEPLPLVAKALRLPPDWNQMSPQKQKEIVKTLEGTNFIPLTFSKQDAKPNQFTMGKSPNLWAYDNSKLKKEPFAWRPGQELTAYSLMSQPLEGYSPIIPKSSFKYFNDLATQMNNGGVVNKYADGVFSVPGPKGAGDVVPAMLSPGEAVIPAKQASKHRGLISSMIAGNIPGYNEGFDPYPGSGYGLGNPMPVAIVKDYTNPVTESKPKTSEEGNENDAENNKKADKRQEKATAETKKSFSDVMKNAFTRTPTTGKVQGALYGASAILGTASMLPGQIGQMAQQALPSIGAMTAAMQLIPGPAGMVVAAFTGLFTVGMQINDHWKKLGEESRALGEALGSGTKAIGKFAEFAKKATATEVMNKRRETSAGAFYNVVEGKQTFGESYMQTDAGKQLVKDVGQATKSIGLQQAKQLIVNQLTTAIVSGALSPEQARSVAANLGAQLGDMQFGIEVIGRMSDLIGPDGKNLKDNPVEVRMKIVAEQTKQFEQVAAQQQKASGQAGSTMAGGIVAGGVVGAGAGIGAAIGGAALSGALSGAAAGTSGAMLGSIVGAQAFGPVVGILAGLAIITVAAVNAQGEIVKNAGYLSASLGSALSTQQQMVDSLQVDYEKRIASAKATGDMAEARRLEKQYLIDQAQLLDFNKQKTQEMYDILNDQGTGLGIIFNAQAANMDAAAEGLKKAFEGTGLDVQAQLAIDTIKKMQGTDVQKTMLLSAVGQKQIGLNQVQTAGALFGGSQEGADTLESLYKNSPVELNRALGLAGGMSAETGKKFIVDMSLKDPIAAKQMNDAVEMAQKTTGVFFGEEKTAKAIMEFAVQNPELMREFQDNIKELQDVDGAKFDITVAQKILGPNLAKALGEKSVGDYFKKYNKQNKIVFLSEFQQVMTMLQEGDADMIKSYNTWNTTNGGKKTFADYAAWQSDRTVTDVGADNTKVPGMDTAGDTGAGPAASFIDPYVQDLRESVRLGQRITVGWKDSLAALKTYSAQSMKTMSGQAVLLQQAGASEGLIQAFLGGSEEDQNRMFAKAKGGISDVARFLIKQTKLVENAKIGMEYILAGTTGRMEKDNQLYQAGLDVIANKEKKINEKYDKRVKALDEISKLQERNNQQQQDTLDLADALSKGDIAAAARAAMKMRQNEQRVALEKAKEGIERARQDELATVSTKILGETQTRADLEARIAANSEKIALAKKNELDSQVAIGKQALANAQTVTNTLSTLKGFSKIKLPVIKASAINTNVINTNSVNDGGNDGGNDSGDGASTSNIVTGLKGVTRLGRDGIGKISRTQANIESGAARTATVKAATTAKSDAQRELVNIFGSSNYNDYAVQNLATQVGNYGLTESVLADIEKNRSKFSSTDRDKIDAFIAKYQKADETLKGTVDAKAFKAQKTADLLSSLPEEVQVAIVKLQNIKTDREALAQPYRDASTKLQEFLDTAGDPANWGKTDKSKNKTLTADKDAKYQALVAFDKENVTPIKKALNSKGYSNAMIKFFTGYARGGYVMPQYFNMGGSAWGLGTDTIPAMLTPGEFVIKKSSVDSIGIDRLNAMNSGAGMGESVYNYSITVNATGTNLNANDLARQVMEQIKRVDSQRIRSNNY